MNGLLTKTTELYTQVNAADFDIYMMTETRLNDSVYSCNLFPPNDFEVYRCDRSKNTSNKESGGGVLISVNKKLKSEIISSGEPTRFSMCSLSFSIKSKTFDIFRKCIRKFPINPNVVNAWKNESAISLTLEAFNRKNEIAAPK